MTALAHDGVASVAVYRTTPAISWDPSTVDRPSAIPNTMIIPVTIQRAFNIPFFASRAYAHIGKINGINLP